MWFPHWRCGLSLLALAACSRAAAQTPPDISLPTYLTNMQRQKTVSIDTMRQWTEPQQFNCFNWEVFTYQNSTAATTAVNYWVSEQGLRTQVVREEPGLLQWKATNGASDFYAVWQANTGNAGLFWLCKGTDHTVSAQRQAAAEAQARPTPTELSLSEPPESSDTRIRIPLWAIFLLGGGLATAASRSIARNPFDPRNDRSEE